MSSTLKCPASLVEAAHDVWTGAHTPAGSDQSVELSKTSRVRSRPLQVTWEMTHDCGWKATPARRRAARNQQHFSTAEAFHLIEQVTAMHVPLLALTGGDPLLRPDLLPVVDFASKRSLRTSLTLLPTPRL